MLEKLNEVMFCTLQGYPPGISLAYFMNERKFHLIKCVNVMRYSLIDYVHEEIFRKYVPILSNQELKSY